MTQRDDAFRLISEVANSEPQIAVLGLITQTLVDIRTELQAIRSILEEK